MIRCLAPLLLLAGCGVPQPTTRIITLTPTVPAPMLSCAPAPAVPQTDHQSVVAGYIVTLWEAGQDCRAHLNAVRSALAK
jgi:hypothetical protein